MSDRPVIAAALALRWRRSGPARPRAAAACGAEPIRWREARKRQEAAATSTARSRRCTHWRPSSRGDRRGRSTATAWRWCARASRAWRSGRCARRWRIRSGSSRRRASSRPARSPPATRTRRSRRWTACSRRSPTTSTRWCCARDAKVATRRDYEGALADAERALALDPDQQSALVTRAVALLLLARTDEAEAALKELGSARGGRGPRSRRGRALLRRARLFARGEGATWEEAERPAREVPGRLSRPTRPW